MSSKQLFSVAKAANPIVDKELITVESSIVASDAISLMHTTRTECLLVVRQHQLVGIFSERDVVRAIALCINVSEIEIGALIDSQVITLPEDVAYNIDVVLTLMQQHQLHYLPIVNSFGQPTGLITKISLQQAQLNDVITLNQQLEQRYCSLFENSAEGIFRTASDGTYLSVNSTLAIMHGYDSPQEMIRAIRDVGQQIYVKSNRRAELINFVEDNGIVWEFESEVYSKDGSTLWVSENVWAVRDEQQNLLYYEGTSIDISARKRSETECQQTELALQQLNAELEARINERTIELTETVERLQQEIAGRQWIEELLLQNEARFQQLAASVPGMIYQYMRYPDGSDALLYLSSACEDIYGVPPEVALERVGFLWERFSPNDFEIIQQLIATSFETLDPFQIECQIVTLKGHLKWLQMSSRPEKQANGSVVWVGIVIDITEFKQTQNALQQSEERFRKIFDESSVGIGLVDPDHCFIEVNRAYCEMLGYSEEELTQMSFIDISHPGDLAEDLCAMQQIFERTLPKFQMEKRYIKKNGDLLWANLTIAPIYDQDGNFLYMLDTLQDITERKRAEAVLRESEKRFRIMADSAPVLLWMSDTDSLCTFFNQGWLNFTGRTLEQEYGTGWAEGVHPDDLQGCIDTRLKAFYAHQPSTMEYRLKRADGEYRWLLDTGVPRFLPDGTFAGYIGSCVDITDRKQAEETLCRSQQQLTDFIENASVGMHWVAEDGTILWANQCEFDLLGYSRDEYIGHHIAEFHADPLTISDILERLIRNETLQGHEARLRCKDGSIRYVYINSNVLWKNGTFVHTRCFTHDITERKRAEEALRQSEERLRLVLQTMPIMMDVFDEEDNIIVWNQECERVTGYTAAEIVGNPKAMEMLYPDSEYRQSMLTEWSKRGCEFRNWEWNMTCKDGSVKTVAWSNLANKFPIPGWAAWSFGVDVSDRKKAETEMLNALEQERELSELKSQFISMVSHEFRTPLSTILSSTELLQRYGQQWPEEKRQLRFRRLIEAVDRMTKLLNDVLLVGKAEAGKLQFSPTVVDVVSFCHELLEELQLTTQAQHILKFTYEGRYQSLYLDAQLLRHILSNLVSNAIKYSPDGGEVHLRLLFEVGAAIFQVQDNGIGISAEDQKELFTIFKRGNNVGTISGTGLGLAIVKQCVDLHGGSIVVESELGKGTLIVVKLPSA